MTVVTTPIARDDEALLSPAARLESSDARASANARSSSEASTSIVARDGGRHDVRVDVESHRARDVESERDARASRRSCCACFERLWSRASQNVSVDGDGGEYDDEEANALARMNARAMAEQRAEAFKASAIGRQRAKEETERKARGGRTSDAGERARASERAKDWAS